MCKHRPNVMTCHACSAADLADIYLAAKYWYYTGDPIMTDVAFDWLEKKIKDTDPRHPCLFAVGFEDNPPEIDLSWRRATLRGGG